jgi:branched-chain amino acid transport system permease protein
MIELLAYGMFFLTVALTYALITLGLNVQWGLTGLFNVGVAAFVAVGAYTSAILTTPPVEGRLGGFGLPVPVGWLAAAVTSALLAAAVAKLTLRLRADYLAITTFGVAVLVQAASLNLEGVTGGAFGITFIPRPFASLASDPVLFGALNLLVVAGAVVAVAAALELLARSPWGRALRAVREDEMAAQALGKSPSKLRLEAFTVGGAVMGIAGAAQAHFVGFIAPENFLPMLTFQVWAMLIVGGSGNTLGAVAGAVLVWAIWAATAAAISAFVPPEHQARAAALQIVMIGTLLAAVLLWRPAGLFPERTRPWKRRDSPATSRSAAS